MKQARIQPYSTDKYCHSTFLIPSNILFTFIWFFFFLLRQKRTSFVLQTNVPPSHRFRRIRIQLELERLIFHFLIFFVENWIRFPLKDKMNSVMKRLYQIWNRICLKLYAVLFFHVVVVISFISISRGYMSFSLNNTFIPFIYFICVFFGYCLSSVRCKWCFGGRKTAIYVKLTKMPYQKTQCIFFFHFPHKMYILFDFR